MINATPFAALAVPTVDGTGREVLIAIVKATFDIGENGRLTLRDEPVAVRPNDVPWSEDGSPSSLRYPSDVCAEKRGTDVIVVGDAISPKPVTSLDVAVRVRGAFVALRVHGPRVYYRGVVDVAVGPAATFERVPLVYERAYGGTSADLSVVESRNPVGVGVARSASDLVGCPAPQIEHPDRPIKSASDRHPPVGFGAIASHWSPRKELAGTFDEAWQKTRMPLLPVDFDVAYNNVAHPSLVFADGLSAGDPVAVLGMSTKKVLSLHVPDLRLGFHARYDDGPWVVLRGPIDTVLIEPDDARVELVSRAVFPIGRGGRVLREVKVDCDGG